MAYRKLSQKEARAWKRRAIRAEHMMDAWRDAPDGTRATLVARLSLPEHHTAMSAMLDLGVVLRLRRSHYGADGFYVQAVNLNPPTDD